MRHRKHKAQGDIRKDAGFSGCQGTHGASCKQDVPDAGATKFTRRCLLVLIAPALFTVCIARYMWRRLLEGAGATYIAEPRAGLASSHDINAPETRDHLLPRMTPLMRWAFKGNERELVRALAMPQASADLDVVSPDQGWSALHFALQGRHQSLSNSAEQLRRLQGNHEACIIELLAARASPRAASPSSLQPLWFAASFRNSIAFDRLLSDGADIHEIAGTRQAILHDLAAQKASGIARLYIKAAMLPEVDTRLLKLLRLRPLSYDANGYLHLANLTEAVSSWDIKRALRAGATVDPLDAKGRAPLHIAAAAAREDAVRVLLEARADATRVDGRGWTALHYAAAVGTEFLAPGLQPLLLSAGAEAEARDPAGRTPAHIREAALNFEHRSSMTAVKDEQIPLNHGGWKAPTTATGSHCDVDVLPPDISPQEFARDYVEPMRPALLRGASLWWPARSEWSRGSIENSFGAVRLGAGSIPYADTYGLKRSILNVSEYLRSIEIWDAQRGGWGVNSSSELPPYIFDAQVLSQHPHLWDLIRVPPQFEQVSTNPILVQFALGPEGTGAPPHFHNAAWNGLIWGRKRWWLFPPKNAFFTAAGVGAHSWASEHSSEPALVCVQEAGDVLFVPRLWGHAVVNEAMSVAVALEFDA